MQKGNTTVRYGLPDCAPTATLPGIVQGVDPPERISQARLPTWMSCAGSCFCVPPWFFFFFLFVPPSTEYLVNGRIVHVIRTTDGTAFFFLSLAALRCFSSLAVVRLPVVCPYNGQVQETLETRPEKVSQPAHG
ncbi:hypothetical protein CGRA01v4_02633 [Colletotrichum graminicola]|nr:hypothetical protein CGRA01v4_02633 [Colletotrichum graminicola]